MKSRLTIIFLAAIMGLLVLSSFSAATDVAVNVEIHAGRAPNTVICSVQNTSDKPQELWYWTCSSWENWESNNKSVSISTWGCKQNVETIRFLAPGETQAWTYHLKPSSGIGERSVSFKMAFKPSQPSAERVAFYNSSQAVINGTFRSTSPLKGPIWSNEITMILKSE